MTTAAIVLAADTGDGFESPKYLTPVHGAPMLVSTVASVAEWSVDTRVVVVGAHGEETAGLVAADGLTIVLDPEWEQGSASPLVVALDLVLKDRSVTHIVIARGDQPGIEADLVDELLDLADLSGAEAVLPKYRYARGWPIVLNAAFCERMLGLEGDIELQDLVSTHASAIEEVWVDRLAEPMYATTEDLPYTRR